MDLMFVAKNEKRHKAVTHFSFLHVVTEETMNGAIALFSLHTNE